MIIEIKGIGIPNKGAELMLVAVMEALVSRYQDVKFVVDPNTDFIGRCRFGIYQKAWMNIKGIQLGYLANLIPAKLLFRFGVIRDTEVDVILDASGFCYSDSFGYENAHEQVGRYIQKWRNDGKKYIFLPQAYGPFENIKLAKSMQQTLNTANLFFARDSVSKKHLEQLVGKDVLMAPDFTCLVKGMLPLDFEPENAGDTCIILNNRMLEKQSSQDGQLYIDNMLVMVGKIRQLGGAPYFLMHEGQDDKQLTNKINQGLSEPLNSYYYESPKHIKGIIGTAKLVISSRFHGLVSALTQGVPVLATGWSHKYQMLLDDYSCPELMLDHLDLQGMFHKLEYIFNSVHYQSVKNVISQAKSKQVELTEHMWSKVFAEIDD